MAGALRWFILLLAAIVVTAVAEPWVVKGVAALGWYDDPTGSVGSALNWLARLTGVAAFPWIAAGVLGFAAGLWLDVLARRFDRGRVPTPTKVSWDADRVLGQLNREADDIVLAGRISSPTAAELQAVVPKLQRLGLPIPDMTKAQSNEWLPAWRIYLTHVAPLLRENELKAARDTANQIVTHMGTLLSHVSESGGSRSG